MDKFIARIIGIHMNPPFARYTLPTTEQVQCSHLIVVCCIWLQLNAPYIRDISKENGAIFFVVVPVNEALIMGLQMAAIHQERIT